MHLGDLIAPEAVKPSLKVKNKKQLLAELAACASQAWAACRSTTKFWPLSLPEIMAT